MSTTALSPPAATTVEVRPLAGAIPLSAWLALGVLFTALAANRFHIGLVGWVAAVPWLIWLRETSGWRARLAFLGAIQLGMALQVAKIVTEPIPWFFVPMYSVPMALSSGLIFVLFEAWRRRVGDRWGLAIFPALAVVAEWVGWRTSELGSWGAAAYSQLDNLPLLQTASLVGLSGIAWLTAATSALIAVGLTDERPRRWLGTATTLALVVTLAHAYGAARLLTRPDGPMVTVGAVVTEVGPGPEGLPSQAVLDANADTLFERSALAVARGAELVVWNEGATSVDVEDEDAFVARGAAFASEHGVDLVMAYIVPLDGMARFENKYVWLGPDGEVETYHKHHPVPGEGSVRGTDPIRAHARPYGSAAGAICYDYDFPSLGLAHAREGAGLVFVPSSDWAGIDPTHTWMARVRGIEGGFSVVRPVRWATTAAFDAFGRPLASMPWSDPGKVMLARVPVTQRPTLYSQTGEVLPMACAGLLALGAVVALRRRRRT